MARKILFSFIIAGTMAGAGPYAQKQKPVHRIITAGSALTEIVCELGHGGEIVATDLTSTYPPAMTSLPNIGYRSTISAEGILAQRPTLILVDKEYVRPELITQLKAAGVALHSFNKSLSFEQTRALIRDVGQVLNEQAGAEALVARLEKELDEVNTLLRKATGKPKVLFVYARGEGTQMIAGRETFTENLIRMAGGEPAVTITGFKPLNTEALIVANPDYILFAEDGLASLGGITGALSIQGVDQTGAGRNRNILTMDMVMMSNFGPRLPRAVKNLLLMIHPELKG